MNASNPVGAWVRTLSGFGRSEAEPVGRLDLIGVDMASGHRAPRNQTIVPAIAAVVIAALVLVGLRMDIVRMRYASAEAVILERQLHEEKRLITVSLLRMREPKLLSERAEQLGFATPGRVITLSSRSKLET
ncbi:MAG: hypothetical protein JRJ58_10920, partial [Deltaproteobacteria bacterium]|nr:hypothetical protein [Deltaproteobacteria bacterium]